VPTLHDDPASSRMAPFVYSSPATTSRAAPQSSPDSDDERPIMGTRGVRQKECPAGAIKLSGQLVISRRCLSRSWACVVLQIPEQNIVPPLCHPNDLSQWSQRFFRERFHLRIFRPFGYLCWPQSLWLVQRRVGWELGVPMQSFIFILPMTTPF
jgi:hypothetical protein